MYISKVEVERKGHLTLSERTFVASVDIGRTYQGVDATGKPVPIIIRARVYRGKEYYADWCLPTPHRPFYRMVPLREHFQEMACPDYFEVSWDETSKSYQPFTFPKLFSRQ